MTTDELVFTESVTYIGTACPDWCTDKPLHRCTDDYGDGRQSRYHQGPAWGRFAIYGEEFTDSPGTVPATASLQLPNDTVDELGPDDLRRIASDALAAAEWLEARA
jgi:hypothetical protein